MERDEPRGPVENITGPTAKDGADSEVCQQDQAEAECRIAGDPAAGIEPMDPMVLWGAWPGEEPIEELLAMLD